MLVNRLMMPILIIKQTKEDADGPSKSKKKKGIGQLLDAKNFDVTRQTGIGQLLDGTAGAMKGTLSVSPMSMFGASTQEEDDEDKVETP